MTVYVATGQTKEYRETALKNVQGAASVINANASKLTKADKQIIGNITAIAAPGADFMDAPKQHAASADDEVLGRVWHLARPLLRGC